MRTIGIMLITALMLCAGFPALAEGGVRAEVIRMDGASVMLLIPESVTVRAQSAAASAAAQAGFALPEYLTLIEEEAFAGIAAERVEVSAGVASIDARAFADCENLREIVIPKSVLAVDDRALDGCRDVTVYGTKGSEAERFASANGFKFVDPEVQTTPPPPGREEPAVQLPTVMR